MPARWGLDNRPRETQSAGVNHGEQTTSSEDVTSHAALSRAADVARTAARVLSAICVCVCERRCLGSKLGTNNTPLCLLYTAVAT